MSVVIVGGHDRMVCQYMKICKNYKCKAKSIYTDVCQHGQADGDHRTCSFSLPTPYLIRW